MSVELLSAVQPFNHEKAGTNLSSRQQFHEIYRILGFPYFLANIPSAFIGKVNL